MTLNFDEWVSSQGPDGIVQFHQYFRGVAQARYVIRKVYRIIDEQSKRAGLDPLEHQALIQTYGTEQQWLTVNKLAERLDVSAALASRLVKNLEGMGLMTRSKSTKDRRVTRVSVTPAGLQKLEEIVDNVWLHVDYFQRQLEPSEKELALAIFGFYVGVRVNVDALDTRGEAGAAGSRAEDGRGGGRARR